MRTHILAFVAQNFLNSKKAMQRFLAKSFYSFQYKSQSHINSMIDDIVEDLLEWQFIEDLGEDRLQGNEDGRAGKPALS